jgi:hypothetical protein
MAGLLVRRPSSHAAESTVDVFVAVATNVVAGFLTLGLGDDECGVDHSRLQSKNKRLLLC